MYNYMVILFGVSAVAFLFVVLSTISAMLNYNGDKKAYDNATTMSAKSIVIFIMSFASAIVIYFMK